MKPRIARTFFNLSAGSVFAIAVAFLFLVSPIQSQATAQVLELGGATPNLRIPNGNGSPNTCDPRYNPGASVIQRTFLISNSTGADFQVTAIRQLTTELKVRTFKTTDIDKGISEYLDENPNNTSTFYVKVGEVFAVSIDMLSSCLEISSLNILYSTESEASSETLVGDSGGYINFATGTGCIPDGSNTTRCNTYVAY